MAACPSGDIDCWRAREQKINEKEQVAIENTAESWLTGIVEVELSMDDKLKNIEDTERAKKQMLENMRKGFTTSAFRVDTKSDKGYQRMDQRDKKKGGRGAAAPKGLTDEDKNMLALPINTNSNFHLSNPVVANVVKKPAAAKPSEGEEGVASTSFRSHGCACSTSCQVADIRRVTLFQGKHQLRRGMTCRPTTWSWRSSRRGSGASWLHCLSLSLLLTTTMVDTGNRSVVGGSGSQGSDLIILVPGLSTS